MSLINSKTEVLINPINMTLILSDDHAYSLTIDFNRMTNGVLYGFKGLQIWYSHFDKLTMTPKSGTITCKTVELLFLRRRLKFLSQAL